MAKCTTFGANESMPHGFPCHLENVRLVNEEDQVTDLPRTTPPFQMTNAPKDIMNYDAFPFAGAGFLLRYKAPSGVACPLR